MKKRPLSLFIKISLDRHLHIISLDVPWPADYGGVVDLFYKLVWLHKLGVKIHLHCFSGGRAPQDELDKYCESVHYYSRNKFPAGLSMHLPYIVRSRNDDALLTNLQGDNYPVLMEGVHCTYLLYKGALQNRKVFVRLHNVEFSYYRKLAANEKNFFKRLYFNIESVLLKRYEKQIAGKAVFWTVSTEDEIVYRKELGAKSIGFLPVFLPWHQVNNQFEKGCFCLYHGNLSVNENVRAVEWLLKEVFNDLPIPFVIAGRNPSEELGVLVHRNNSCCLVANPSEKEMQDLVKKAQLNVLPSFNNTGVKLKILNALYNGKHCLVNDAAAGGAGFEGLCSIANTATEFKQQISELYSEPYNEKNAAERQQVLDESYNNEKNARQLISWIY
jgi:glycosyltransferase involved in cell wall biosynthesis